VRRLVPTLFALVVWLALWGEISVVNVASGVLVVAILALLFRPEPRGHRLHPLALMRLLVVFVWRLMSSSATVVLAVLAPTPARLRSGVVGVELSHPSSLVATIVADAISLTPGTLTLEARYADGDADGDGEPGEVAPVLYIHVLGLSDPAAIRNDVRRLERLVVSAITPTGSGSGAVPGDHAEERAR
jgi:multicomponent Na+:H+ antiporter subunit E